MLQLGLGCLLLLYHSSLGKHIRIKTRRLASNFILGISLMTILILSASCFFIATLAGGTLSLLELSAVVGILVALAFCAWFFYYKSGRSTELWLPKSVTRFINRRAKKTESNVEAFSLGLLASFAEIPFSLVLMLVAGNSILELGSIWQPVAIMGYTLVALSPLVILRVCVRRGKTVVDIQRWRTKNKNFFRTLLGIGFLTLAAFLVAFKLMGVH
jgi:hypothetical protein